MTAEDGTPVWGTRRGPVVPYIPGLDGLRALAVAAVVVYHADPRLLGGGFLGVEVFFVISGYLITLLLVAERERTGSVSLRAFWMRRARRLLPALWLLLAVLAVFTALFERDRLGLLRGDTLGGFFYGANWFQVWTGSSYTSTFAFAPLRHLWSLAVEEQFYLVWPVVMWLVLRRARRTSAPAVALAFTAAAAGTALMTALVYRTGPVGTFAETPGQYMTFLGHRVLRTDFLYLGTFSRSSGLFLGAALAMVWRPWALVQRRAREGRSGPVALLDAVGIAGLVALGFMCWRFREVVRGDTEHGYDLLYRGGFLLVGVASVAVIMSVTAPRSVLGRFLLGHRALVWLGTRSYGFYLYHWAIFQVYRKTAGTPLSLAELSWLVAAALVAAEVSYRFLETPVRRGALGRARLRARRAARAPGGGQRGWVAPFAAASALLLFAAGSMATARVIPDEITAGLEENEEAVVTIPVIPTLAPRPTLAPGVTTVPMPTTSPPRIIDVLAVGDSVMLGSAKKLTREGFTVDAAKNRQPLDALQIFNYYRSTKELGSTVVIHLGTNGTTKASVFAQVMKPLKEVRKVIVLTVRVPTREYEKKNNDIIYALAGKHPNVTVLDWYTLSANHPEWFAKDKVHPNDAGQDAYVAAIAAAVRG